MNVNLSSPFRPPGPVAAGAGRRARRAPGGILLRPVATTSATVRPFGGVRVFQTRVTGAIHNFGAQVSHWLRR